MMTLRILISMLMVIILMRIVLEWCLSRMRAVRPEILLPVGGVPVPRAVAFLRHEQ